MRGTPARQQLSANVLEQVNATTMYLRGIEIHQDGRKVFWPAENQVGLLNGTRTGRGVQFSR